MPTVKHHQEQMFQTVLCKNCETVLGYLETYIVTKKAPEGMMLYPWSMAGVTEMRLKTEEELEFERAKLKCSCRSWFTVPN